jgi:uncharacterized membrane protein YccC
MFRDRKFSAGQRPFLVKYSASSRTDAVAEYNVPPMPDWVGRIGLGQKTIIQSARVAVAAVISLWLARALKLPEFYWAPISSIVVILSTIDPMAMAWQRFVGTAVGAVFGALVASFFPANWMVYGAGIFVCGILSALLRLGSAYRFAGITLTLVLLVNRGSSPWIVALHRFVEVSLGIAVALVVMLVWRVES